MYTQAWEEIEKIYQLPKVIPSTIAKFQDLNRSQESHTKKEGNPHHYCSFFLPFDKSKQMIYLGNHKKAKDWIPPGGHIEPGETPSDAAVREMKEELTVTITKSMLEPFNLSVKPINRLESGCMAHYDVWHLVHIPVQNFSFLESEYYDARWFPIPEGIAMIKYNPDFAKVISNLTHYV